MARRHRFDGLVRERSTGNLEEGRSVTNASREFSIADTIVSRVLEVFRTTDTAARMGRVGWPRTLQIKIISILIKTTPSKFTSTILMYVYQ
ncbi:hypothetical protein RB195_025478 [Necator americanus]|uniref:HTH psq-type domain-containing protein n=1 Tax=Necator americanus TaxID=51031 RepID=A0ABR1ESH1_NECAM